MEAPNHFIRLGDTEAGELVEVLPKSSQPESYYAVVIHAERGYRLGGRRRVIVELVDWAIPEPERFPYWNLNGSNPHLRLSDSTRVRRWVEPVDDHRDLDPRFGSEFH